MHVHGSSNNDLVYSACLSIKCALDFSHSQFTLRILSQLMQLTSLTRKAHPCFIFRPYIFGLNYLQCEWTLVASLFHIKFLVDCNREIVNSKLLMTWRKIGSVSHRRFRDYYLTEHVLQTPWWRAQRLACLIYDSRPGQQIESFKGKIDLAIYCLSNIVQGGDRIGQTLALY